MLKLIKKRYDEHRKNTLHRVDANGDPILFKLTFEEWFGIWEESDKWSERGRGAGKYVMCRYDDIGHYEVGNVYIGKVEDNSGDAARRGNSGQFKKGHVFSDEMKQKFSDAQKKRWANVDRENTEFWKPSEEQRQKLSEAHKKAWEDPERKEKMSKLMKGRKMERAICPHCNKEGAGGTMKRWHFDNCKFK